MVTDQFQARPVNLFLLMCQRLINKWENVLLVIKCHQMCICSLLFYFKKWRESNTFVVLGRMSIAYKDFHQLHSNWTEINIPLWQQSLGILGCLEHCISIIWSSWTVNLSVTVSCPFSLWIEWHLSVSNSICPSLLKLLIISHCSGSWM